MTINKTIIGYTREKLTVMWSYLGWQHSVLESMSIDLLSLPDKAEAGSTLVPDWESRKRVRELYFARS